MLLNLQNHFYIRPSDRTWESQGDAPTKKFGDPGFDHWLDYREARPTRGLGHLRSPHTVGNPQCYPQKLPQSRAFHSCRVFDQTTGAHCCKLPWVRLLQQWRCFRLSEHCLGSHCYNYLHTVATIDLVHTITIIFTLSRPLPWFTLLRVSSHCNHNSLGSSFHVTISALGLPFVALLTSSPASWREEHFREFQCTPKGTCFFYPQSVSSTTFGTWSKLITLVTATAHPLITNLTAYGLSEVKLLSPSVIDTCNSII
jgi:hypothetical protein